MTFAFAAAGAQADVAEQLEHAQITTGEDRFNEFGAELRDLVARHIRADKTSTPAGHEYRYTVKASGHGGGALPLSVQLSIEPIWVAVPVDEMPADEAV